MFAAGEIKGKKLYAQKWHWFIELSETYTLSPMISLILLFQIFCYNVDHKKNVKRKEILH